MGKNTGRVYPCTKCFTKHTAPTGRKCTMAEANNGNTGDSHEKTMDNEVEQSDHNTDSEVELDGTRTRTTNTDGDRTHKDASRERWTPTPDPTPIVKTQQQNQIPQPTAAQGGPPAQQTAQQSATPTGHQSTPQMAQQQAPMPYSLPQGHLAPQMQGYPWPQYPMPPAPPPWMWPPTAPAAPAFPRDAASPLAALDMLKK